MSANIPRTTLLVLGLGALPLGRSLQAQAAIPVGQGATSESIELSYRLQELERNEVQEPHIKTLMTKGLAGAPGKETLMLTVEYPPGANEPVHRHNAQAFVYVLEGSVVMQVKGQSPVTLEPGDTFYEGNEDVHLVGRNASRTSPARFVVFLVKEKGAPVVLPAQ